MKNNSQNVNIGSSSILMIFVVLCLISFATLSIASSKSDYNLSDKFAQKTSAYYLACNSAERSIASIDQSLKQTASSLTEAEYFTVVGNSMSFYIPINDLQSLYIALVPLYPINEGDSYYSLTHYEVVTLKSLEPDNSLNFFTP